MKTYKNLYPKLCSMENLMLAFRRAKKGKSKEDYVIKYESNLIQNLKQLQEELMSKTYSPNPLFFSGEY